MPQNPADGKVLIFVSLVMRVLLFPNLSEIAKGKKLILQILTVCALALYSLLGLGRTGL